MKLSINLLCQQDVFITLCSKVRMLVLLMAGGRASIPTQNGDIAIKCVKRRWEQMHLYTKTPPPTL